jgi:hypothetical protein
MADWRQIQARIRKAKSSSDPPAQLGELYERTRDAMVAFELAVWQEKAGDNGEAARWYTSAAQRFRRALWRTKAEEALTRLGAPIPAPMTESQVETSSTESQGLETTSLGKTTSAEKTISAGLGGQSPELEIEISAESTEEVSMVSAAPITEGSADGAAPKRKRRRGRRGGRGRLRGKGGTQAAAGGAGNGASAPTRSSLAAPAPPPYSKTPMSLPERPEAEARPATELRSTVERTAVERPTTEQSQPPAPAPSWQSRTRTGEPALASRISQLESQVRRLLACPQSSLEESDQAPAGPGVLLLSDSDQVTHYYIEACQTLRIGVGNLLRGGRGSEAVHLKERLAENLGIAEARVPKYLKDHCAVRWLQLDEGAKELAHFAIAVLRPAVNE